MEIVQIIITIILILALSFLTYILIKNSELGEIISSNFNKNALDHNTVNMNIPISTNNLAQNKATSNSMAQNNVALNNVAINHANNKLNINNKNNLTTVNGVLGQTQRYCFDLSCPAPPSVCCPPCPPCNTCLKPVVIVEPEVKSVTEVSCCRKVRGDCGCSKN